MKVAVGAYFSPAYAHWFPGWLESVRALKRQPDVVVVVAAGKVPSDVRRVKPVGPFTYSDWRNQLAEACGDADYFVGVDVDDRYLPTALDGCDAWDTDVVAYGLRYVDGRGKERTWVAAPSRDQVAAGQNNLVPEGSPLRLDLWRRIRWDHKWAPFADWAFWVEAARSGASFSATGRVDYLYRWHADTPTDERGIRALLAQR